MTEHDPWPAVESSPAPLIACTCYPGGFTADTYEGPQEDCPVHGRLPAFYLTFGQRHRRDLHPRGSWIHPDGYVVVQASSYEAARLVVVDLFGLHWSDLYPADQFGTGYSTAAEMYPLGELLRIVVPAGLVEQEDHR